jgi:hypothetical protein
LLIKNLGFKALQCQWSFKKDIVTSKLSTGIGLLADTHSMQEITKPTRIINTWVTLIINVI